MDGDGKPKRRDETLSSSSDRGGPEAKEPARLDRSAI
jgi:hypothetical protein